jgi:L-fuculose-phosphate aldolase
VRYENEKRELISYGRRIKEAGYVLGTAGNLSLRPAGADDQFLVTPSGMDYDQLVPSDIVLCNMQLGVLEGNRKPSVESTLHRDIYQARPDVRAVIHTHALYATAMATARLTLPVIEAELAMVGERVEVAEYADSATPQLARNAVQALGTNQAVLLANHGLVVVGQTLKQALDHTQLIEVAAHKFILASVLGKVFEIPPESCRRIREFKRESYGQR